MAVLTPNQVKKQFKDKGQTQKEWALAHGYQPCQVTRILNGTWKGTRGKGHEIAVALGLKDPSAA